MPSGRASSITGAPLEGSQYDDPNLVEEAPPGLTYWDNNLTSWDIEPRTTPLPRLIRSAVLSNYVEVARSAGLDPYRMISEFRLPAACARGRDVLFADEFRAR